MEISIEIRWTARKNYLCLFLQIKHIDFLYFTFLQVDVSTGAVEDDRACADQTKEEDLFVRSKSGLRIWSRRIPLRRDGGSGAELLDELHTAVSSAPPDNVINSVSPS